jgi:hypothetical protein
MPLVRISVLEEMAAERRRMVAAAVETASSCFQLTRRMTEWLPRTLCRCGDKRLCARPRNTPAWLLFSGTSCWLIS